jgi:phosphosulfolactate synthase
MPHTSQSGASGLLRTSDYLRQLGVREVPRRTSPFDPGYDPSTLMSHLEQSSHLMSTLKISMACWLVANEESTRRKVAAAASRNVPTVTGGGPFEVAVAQGQLSAYLDLCADIGVTRIEAGAGFTQPRLKPATIVAMANRRGLAVQFEIGKKHDGPFTQRVVAGLTDIGHRWLDAGAAQLIVEARESARGVGLFDEAGRFQPRFADAFARAFGLETVSFEAPTKASQFALIDHFGGDVGLCNIRLEELLRVEIYRRGLHSDAFAKSNLRPLGVPRREAR